MVRSVFHCYIDLAIARLHLEGFASHTSDNGSIGEKYYSTFTCGKIWLKTNQACIIVTYSIVRIKLHCQVKLLVEETVAAPLDILLYADDV